MLFYNHFYEPRGKGCCFGESLKHWFTWVLDSKPLGETETKAWFHGMTVIGDPILALKPPLYEEIIANITDVIALYETYSQLRGDIRA